MKLQLKSVRLDGGTQPRQFVNEDVVNEYSEHMLEEAAFPPVDVFHDGANYWLVDGFHRYFATKKAGFLDIEATVHQGTRRDAVLFSIGAKYFPAAELNLLSLVEVVGGVVWVYLPIFGINETPNVLTVIGGCIVSGAILLDSVGARYSQEAIKL